MSKVRQQSRVQQDINVSAYSLHGDPRGHGRQQVMMLGGITVIYHGWMFAVETTPWLQRQCGGDAAI